MNPRDAAGRFVRRNVRHARAWYQGWKAAAVSVGVGVSVKDIHYKSPHHNVSSASSTTHHHHAMGRSKTRKGKRSRRSRSKAHRKGVKRTTKKRGGVRRKNHTSLTIGRLWPPSEMIGSFTTQRELAIASGSSTTTGHFWAMQLHSAVDSPGHVYDNNDATAGKTNLTSFEPRNWDFMTNLYNRCRLLSFGHQLQIVMMNGTTDQNSSFWLCYWYSSDLDPSNPLADLNSDLGSSAPWSSADQFRDILLQSRRVHKRLLKGPGMPGGKAVHTIQLQIGNCLQDRLGNRVLGGKHVRDTTNNPGGTVHTTDKDITDGLTERWGIDNKINIVLFESEVGNTSLPAAFRLTSHPKLQFFDRRLENQTSPA